MTQNERLVLRLTALGLLAILIAVVQSVLRGRHPMRWARRNAHEVIDPLEDAAIDMLGLRTPGREPMDVAADAGFTALGVVDVLRHRHQAQ